MALDPLRKTDPDWFTFDWLERLVPEWRPNTHYSDGQVVRPIVPCGAYLVCSTAGLSAARLNAVPAAGSTLADGKGLVWTVTVPSGASVPKPASAVYATNPSGIVELSSDLDADRMITRVRLDAGAADVGDYTLTATMTDTAGEEHVASSALEVIA